MNLRWWNVYGKALAILLLLAPGALKAIVLDPPSLRCIAVDPGGAATLTWTLPADPTGEFLRYEVFRSNTVAGPYTLVAPLVTYAQTSWIDPAAAANSAPRYYYLTTVSTSAPPNTSLPSDTLASMFLQVTQSVPLGSSVVDWNLPHTPPIVTADSLAFISMEHPTGTWALVDSANASVHHWQRVVSICQDSLNFSVALLDASGCISTSSVTGAMFQDITPPSIPLVVNVTVDTATNQATVNWGPSPEMDTRGYIIVLATPGGNTILDTLQGRLNNSYTWAMSQAGAGPESYTIAAIDSCFKGNPPSPNTSATHAPHTTVFVSTVYDRCAGTIRVVRTDYGGWPVDHYELYGRLDHTGPWTYLATQSVGTQEYLQANAVPGHVYCFLVRAIGVLPGQVSLSNQVCRPTTYPAMPQWNYLRVASVANAQEVVVTDSMDITGYTRRLVLQRTSNGGPWQEVLAINGAVGPVVQFTDGLARTAERSYSYRVLVEDSCGNTVVTSNLGTSILLTTTPEPGNNILRWNGYVQWAGTVQGYNVYRSVAGGPFALVASVGAAQWEYTDQVDDFYQTAGKFCYYVEAIEAANPAGTNARSLSNIACAVQREEIWVPNAFIEGGYNNTFKPVLAYADAARYEFTIFNRWGQQIWTTTDPAQAWDGRVNGSVVPQGVYAWYCAFRNGTGKTVEKRGTVTFLAGR